MTADELLVFHKKTIKKKMKKPTSQFIHQLHRLPSTLQLYYLPAPVAVGSWSGSGRSQQRTAGPQWPNKISRTNTAQLRSTGLRRGEEVMGHIHTFFIINITGGIKWRDKSPCFIFSKLGFTVGFKAWNRIIKKLRNKQKQTKIFKIKSPHKVICGETDQSLTQV